jgi:streptomycin 3"-adenylyltransferase
MIGLYLTGSAVMGGLRPNSDIDVVLVTERVLTHAERRDMIEVLLRISGRPTEPVRPIELRCVAVADIVPWTYPPMCDLLYGEWLRETFAHGSLPERHLSADLAILLSTLLRHFLIVRGPAPGDVIDPIPNADLRRAILDNLPCLLHDLLGDERNVILTLARMLVTITTGEIVSKDDAAHRIGPDLLEPDRVLVHQAAAGYLGDVQDDWSRCQQQAQETADHLAAAIRTSAAGLG